MAAKSTVGEAVAVSLVMVVLLWVELKSAFTAMVLVAFMQIPFRTVRW